MPQLDIQSIGSGGGSIIWIDELSGTMKVGPQSAGADPGPACYNRGGQEPTITDANVILGYVNPDNFLGGKYTLDKESSLHAMRRVADQLHLDAVEAASGAVQIVEFHMADLMRQMTVQRGLDPRDFVVYAYGGGGPVHAVSYSRELGCNVARLRKAPKREHRKVETAHGRKIAEGLVLVDGMIACSKCEQELCSAAENYKLHCAVTGRPIKATNPYVLDPKIYVDDKMVFRGYACPSCGLLLQMEMARPTDPPLWDIQLAV